MLTRTCRWVFGFHLFESIQVLFIRANRLKKPYGMVFGRMRLEHLIGAILWFKASHKEARIFERNALRVHACLCTLNPFLWYTVILSDRTALAVVITVDRSAGNILIGFVSVAGRVDSIKNEKLSHYIAYGVRTKALIDLVLEYSRFDAAIDKAGKSFQECFTQLMRVERVDGRQIDVEWAAFIAPSIRLW